MFKLPNTRFIMANLDTPIYGAIGISFCTEIQLSNRYLTLYLPTFKQPPHGFKPHSNYFSYFGALWVIGLTGILRSSCHDWRWLFTLCAANNQYLHIGWKKPWLTSKVLPFLKTVSSGLVEKLLPLNGYPFLGNRTIGSCQSSDNAPSTEPKKKLQRIYPPQQHN